jgi:hypothetical protein
MSIIHNLTISPLKTFIGRNVPDKTAAIFCNLNEKNSIRNTITLKIIKITLYSYG